MVYEPSLGLLLWALQCFRQLCQRDGDAVTHGRSTGHVLVLLRSCLPMPVPADITRPSADPADVGASQQVPLLPLLPLGFSQQSSQGDLLKRAAYKVNI